MCQNSDLMQQLRRKVCIPAPESQGNLLHPHDSSWHDSAHPWDSRTNLFEDTSWGWYSLLLCLAQPKAQASGEAKELCLCLCLPSKSKSESQQGRLWTKLVQLQVFAQKTELCLLHKLCWKLQQDLLNRQISEIL